MRTVSKISRRAVATTLLFFALIVTPLFAVAQTEKLDALFIELADPALTDWAAVESQIWQEWSHSGSDAMDLLLQRGKRAMAQGNYPLAIEHFTALTDHAPEFAEGWNMRATAFFLAQNFGMSVSDIQTTLALNPRHFGALSGLGMILETLEQNDGALRAYRAAMAVHPHRPNLIEAVKRLEKKIGGTSL